MKTRELTVLTLRPDPADPLGLDLKQILAAFGDQLADWTWWTKDVDWLGGDGGPVGRAIEAAGPEGSWIDSWDLLGAVGAIYQTIEGEFLAFPRSIDRRNLQALDLNLASFPEGRAAVAVVAVDGGCFDVYSKDPEATHRLLATFPDATIEDTGLYFGR